MKPVTLDVGSVLALPCVYLGLGHSTAAIKVIEVEETSDKGIFILDCQILTEGDEWQLKDDRMYPCISLGCKVRLKKKIALLMGLVRGSDLSLMIIADQNVTRRIARFEEMKA